MGREHGRKGKHFLLYLAAGMMSSILLCGCMQTYQSRQGKEKLRNSEILMQRGDYRSAMEQKMEVYRDYRDLLGDQALFQAGLLHAHPDNPESDYRKATDTFEKLSKEFPDSPILSEAAVCARLLRIIEELQEHMHSLETTYDASRAALLQLEKKVDEKEKRIARYHRRESSSQAAIDQLRAEIFGLQGRLDQLEARLSELKKIDLMMEEKRRRALP